MASDNATTEDDLAFLRRLVAGDDGAAWRRGFGTMYALWGAVFAVPLFMEWGRWMGWLKLPANFWTLAAIVMTLVITVISIWAARRAPPVTGAQPKALNAMFGGVGWANVAVLGALVMVAFRLGDGRIMMLHAVVVFAFQGAAWYAVWALRKRTWTGLVAAGWFVFAAALGATMPTHWFILLAAVGLTVLMVAPGVAMMRSAPKAA